MHSLQYTIQHIVYKYNTLLLLSFNVNFSTQYLIQDIFHSDQYLTKYSAIVCNSLHRTVHSDKQDHLIDGLAPHLFINHNWL